MVDYQKLYAFLVGQIDDTLQQICENLMTGHHGWHELNAVGEKLRNALLAAEEIVLDDTEK